MNEIRPARKEDEDALRDIMLDAEMDLAGDIENHAVIISDNIVVGGLLLSVQNGGFHVEVIAVKDDMHGGGIGHALMDSVSKHPWAFVRGCHAPKGGKYKITAIAKGSSVSFYKKCGFEVRTFDEVPEEYQNQCNECDDRVECAPQAVVYEGGVS